MAIYCEDTLNVLFDKNIFPTYRILQALVLKDSELSFPYDNMSNYLPGNKFLSIHDIISLIDGYAEHVALDPTIYTHLSEFQLYNAFKFNNLVLPQLNKEITLDNINLHNYDEAQMRYLKEIYQVVKKPTVYFIPNNNDLSGQVIHYEVKYDIDIQFYLPITSPLNYTSVLNLLREDANRAYIKNMTDVIYS